MHLDSHFFYRYLLFKKVGRNLPNRKFGTDLGAKNIPLLHLALRKATREKTNGIRTGIFVVVYFFDHHQPADSSQTPIKIYNTNELQKKRIDTDR